MLDIYTMFARYNGWANRKTLEAVAAVSEEDYRRDCGLFFNSLHGTLNHLLVADLIWMKRFAGEGEVPQDLSAVLHENFTELVEARRAVDDRIIDWTAQLSEADLSGDFAYRPVTEPRDPVTQKLAPALSHFFNHQTHHRGHCHAALTQIAGEAPSIDLIYFQREERLGTAA